MILKDVSARFAADVTLDNLTK